MSRRDVAHVARYVFALLLLGGGAWRLYLESVSPSGVRELTIERAVLTAIMLAAIILLIAPRDRYMAFIDGLLKVLGRNGKK